jgi:hypothetical protein
MEMVSKKFKDQAPTIPQHIAIIMDGSFHCTWC